MYVCLSVSTEISFESVLENLFLKAAICTKLLCVTQFCIFWFFTTCNANSTLRLNLKLDGPWFEPRQEDEISKYPERLWTLPTLLFADFRCFFLEVKWWGLVSLACI